MTAIDIRPGHRVSDTQTHTAGSEQTTPQARTRSTTRRDPPAGGKPATGQNVRDAQSLSAGGSDSANSQPSIDTHTRLAVGLDLPARQDSRDAQTPAAGGDADHLDGHLPFDTHDERAVEGEDGSPATIGLSTSRLATSLADPLLLLAFAADVVDDLENTRKANENRLRQLTRTDVDKDGEVRGFGLDESHPDVARLAALVAKLSEVEHDAVLQLQRTMRRHPLGPWVKAHKGIGEKQAARLLAVIGDPYWNTLHNRPRTVSELWAYAGYHTLPAGQCRHDTHTSTAGGAQDSGGDQASPATQKPHVAARRRKGTKANWSTVAKTRAYLIAESCMKAGGPYRGVYDKRKANTEGRVHVAPCPQCDGAGSTKVGTPWRDGHRHADALRITAKAVLRDLWREAKRIHEAVPPASLSHEYDRVDGRRTA